ncbi:MbcA/ParS/Xre antitoxin family protein [Pseudomonas defluvii]|nr:MbcA/ParS/Xre antitoxin family protein [Pseudomonas defluvii]
MKTKMNFEELIRRQAELVFGSKIKAHVWLARPRVEFGGSTALECARVEAGYLRVKALLERMDHGYAC